MSYHIKFQDFWISPLLIHKLLFLLCCFNPLISTFYKLLNFHFIKHIIFKIVYIYYYAKRKLLFFNHQKYMFIKYILFLIEHNYYFLIFSILYITLLKYSIVFKNICLIQHHLNSQYTNTLKTFYFNLLNNSSEFQILLIMLYFEN